VESQKYVLLISYFGHFKFTYQLLTFMQCRIWDVIGLWMANQQEYEEKRAILFQGSVCLGAPLSAHDSLAFVDKASIV
jgi:hypothetical protein